MSLISNKINSTAKLFLSREETPPSCPNPFCWQIWRKFNKFKMNWQNPESPVKEQEDHPTQNIAFVTFDKFNDTF